MSVKNKFLFTMTGEQWDFYLGSAGIRSSNLSVTGPPLLPQDYLPPLTAELLFSTPDVPGHVILQHTSTTTEHKATPRL